MALGDALFCETPQYRLDQRRGDTSPATTGVDHQMLQVAASPVVTSQQATDDPPLVLGQQTETRIASQIGAERGIGILITQLDARRTPPESMEGGMIGRRNFTQLHGNSR